MAPSHLLSSSRTAQSLGIDTSAPFTAGLSGGAAATYVLTAIATDNNGATATSAPITVAVLAIPNRFNMALASNGGVASASSILNNNYPASGAINGDRPRPELGRGRRME
jgi:hypothetical protein